MTAPADDAHGTLACLGLTLDDLWLQFGDRWDITLITGGYRALNHDAAVRTSVPLYGRTPAELAESIRMAEGPTVTGWDVLTGRAAMPSGMLTELAALRAALPGYDVIVTSHSPGYRFEAIRRRAGAPGPWCVISADPGDLWRELVPLAVR